MLNDSSLYFFQDLPESSQFQSEFYLLVQRLSVRPEGRLSTSSGPTTTAVFPLTDTENDSTKLTGSNKVLMHQDQSQISGEVLNWAMKSCSAF